MFAKNLALPSILCLAAAPAAAEKPKVATPDAIEPDNGNPGASQTGGQSYGDRNRGGPYGFYSYPRHRSVGGGGGLDRGPSTSVGDGTSPYYDSAHGSAYYGRDYGAPYFGGGYYDRGTYYRERRD